MSLLALKIKSRLLNAKYFKFRNAGHGVWLYVAYLLWFFCAVSTVILMYCITGVIYSLWRRRQSWHFSTCAAPLLSYVSFIFTFLVLFCKRATLIPLVLDVVNASNAVGGRITRRLTTRLTISLICVSLVVCFDVATAINVMKATFDHVYKSDILEDYCFGCNYTSLDAGTFKAYFYFISASHGPAVIFNSFLQILLYCYLASALAEITKHSVSEFASEAESGSLENLSWLRTRLYHVGALVDRLNRVFKNVVLVWCGSTLLATCRNVTEFVNWLVNPSVFIMDQGYHLYWLRHLKDVVLLVSLIVVASRLPEEWDKIGKYLPQLTDGALAEGRSAELTIFYHELASRKLALQAGSCFHITKKMLLSFLGLGVTYTFIFVQFKPKLMSTIG